MQSRLSPFAGLSHFCRIGLFLVGAVLLVLLTAAASVEPDRRGWGTHQQFGLPGCTIQQVFGWRCPACGMTTAWAHFMRGRWFAALSCNAGGAVLALACAAIVPWTMVTAIRGEWVWLKPTDGRALLFCFAIVTITIGDWLVRLAIFYAAQR